ncbi:hypothetical protein DsansV1_C01g0009391 [Dioscorea sansibarensis]
MAIVGMYMCVPAGTLNFPSLTFLEVNLFSATAGGYKRSVSFNTMLTNFSLLKSSAFGRFSQPHT